jgi:germination protein M
MLRRWGVVLLAGLALVVLGLGGCGEKTGEPANAEPQDVAAGTGQTSLRDTLLYYRDGSGYVVPVMRQIPWEEGIGKAALRFLIAGSDEDVALAAQGIYAPLPAGTKVDLDINDGLATVDLTFQTNCATAADESAMVAAVVNTLLEFQTVDRVKLLSGGRKVEKLPLGTSVSEYYTEQIQNVEPAGAPNTGEGKIQLYFTNETGSFLVPCCG